MASMAYQGKINKGHSDLLPCTTYKTSPTLSQHHTSLVQTWGSSNSQLSWRHWRVGIDFQTVGVDSNENVACASCISCEPDGQDWILWHGEWLNTYPKNFVHLPKKLLFTFVNCRILVFLVLEVGNLWTCISYQAELVNSLNVMILAKSNHSNNY